MSNATNMSTNQASQCGSGSGASQRQLNIRAMYPQVKQSTTPVSFEAGPVITFDNHYSSDEEMAPNAKRVVLLGQ